MSVQAKLYGMGHHCQTKHRWPAMWQNV